MVGQPAAGRQLASEAVDAGDRNYGYDRAGRLTQAVDSGILVRNYAYDASTNRCAQAPTCASPAYAYDFADRLTSSPWASAYAYDSHGNLRSATLRDPLPPDTLTEKYDPAGPSRTWPLSVGRSGTLAASADWQATDDPCGPDGVGGGGECDGQSPAQLPPSCAWSFATRPARWWPPTTGPSRPPWSPP